MNLTERRLQFLAGKIESAPGPVYAFRGAILTGEDVEIFTTPIPDYLALMHRLGFEQVGEFPLLCATLPSEGETRKCDPVTYIHMRPDGLIVAADTWDVNDVFVIHSADIAFQWMPDYPQAAIYPQNLLAEGRLEMAGPSDKIFIGRKYIVGNVGPLGHFIRRLEEYGDFQLTALDAHELMDCFVTRNEMKLLNDKNTGGNEGMVPLLLDNLQKQRAGIIARNHPWVDEMLKNGTKPLAVSDPPAPGENDQP